LALFAAVAVVPAAANELVAGSVPPAGETILIPAQPFLDQRNIKPDFFEAVVERMRDFQRFMRRQLEQPEVALGEEEVSVTPENQSIGQDEAKREAQRLVAEALDPEDIGELAAAPDPRTLPEAHSIGVHDAALLGFDAADVSIAAPGRTGGSGGTASPGIALAAEAPRRDPIFLALDVLRWLRREPLVTVLIVTGLALLAWVRHASVQRG
jgi:hypothetical protein